MGYGVTAHIAREPVEPESLKALPRGLRWRLYRDEAAGAWLIDVFAGERGAEHPFTQDPYAFEEQKNPALAPLYRALATVGLDDAAPRGLSSLNVRLSGALKQEVLSVTADDDELDVVCVSRGGTLKAMEVSNWRARFVWSAGQGVRVQLRTDPEDDEAEPLDASAFEDLADVTVLPQAAKMRRQLHDLAMRRAREFLGGQPTFLDLGSFDCLTRVPKPIAESGGPQGTSPGKSPPPQRGGRGLFGLFGRR